MDNNNQEKSGFTYTYSAKEQAELKRIRDKYTAPTEEEDKMARLRRLDASVTNTAQAVALVFGILGTLILGFGMSLIMTNLYDFLGIGETIAPVIGIPVGIVGGILASLAYPVYNVIVKAKRKKHAPEIIRLTDELMKWGAKNTPFFNLDIDVIFISGWNPFGTLKLIRDSGFDKAIIDYVHRWVIYIGGSAGAHIATADITHID